MTAPFQVTLKYKLQTSDIYPQVLFYQKAFNKSPPFPFQALLYTLVCSIYHLAEVEADKVYGLLWFLLSHNKSLSVFYIVLPFSQCTWLCFLLISTLW